MNLTPIFIVAIICWAIVSIVQGPKRKHSAKPNTDETDALKAEVASLKERVATLEKIVTDEKYNLNKEFENLKKTDAA